MSEYEERCITLAIDKPNQMKIGSKTLILGTGCLFYAIERFLQKAYMTRHRLIYKSRVLKHIDGLIEMPMKGGILDI